MTILVVTGTSTDVGKTVTTAALAACAQRSGRSVVVVKPAQTGLAGGDPGDAHEAARLAGCAAVELHRFLEPLAPAAAARQAGAPYLDLEDCAATITGLAHQFDLVLVEGAGGLLVRLDGRGRTIADLATLLKCSCLVVAAAGLGTLNHTALTLEALDRRRIPLSGVVIGSWPNFPDSAALSNLADLTEIIGEPIQGAIAQGAATSDPETFRTIAVAGLSPRFGGHFNVEHLSPSPTHPSDEPEDGL